MKKILFLDDRRNPFEKDWKDWIFKYGSTENIENYEVVWVKSFKAFTDWITENGLPIEIFFDHDISDFTGVDGTELRGIDCAKWLVEYCLDNNLSMPPYAIQSSNYDGRENIDGLLKSFVKNVKQ